MPETPETQAAEETLSPEAVAPSSDKTPTSQETGAEGEGTETQRQDNRVPQSRFNEVVAEKNTYKEEVEALRQQVAGRDDKLGKLVGLLDAQKESVTLVDNLRNLAATSEDPDVKKSIDLLDAELTGTRKAIEEVAEGKVAEGALTRDEANKLVAERTAKLEDNIAEERAQRLFDQSNLKAEKMLGGLPDDYNDEDKKYIAEAWIKRVDWDNMEENTEEMDNLLATSLQETLDFYGTPRGSLMRAAEATPVTEDGEPIKAEPTPEEEIEKLKDIDWSSMEDGKPKYSDEVFSAGMAEALRAARRRSS